MYTFATKRAMKAKRRSSWLPCEKFELSRRKWRVPTDSHFQANGGHLILWTVLPIIPTAPFQSSHFRPPSSSDGLPSVPFKTKQNRTKNSHTVQSRPSRRAGSCQSIHHVARFGGTVCVPVCAYGAMCTIRQDEFPCGYIFIVPIKHFLLD